MHHKKYNSDKKKKSGLEQRDTGIWGKPVETWMIQVREDSKHPRTVEGRMDTGGELTGAGPKHRCTSDYSLGWSGMRWNHGPTQAKQWDTDVYNHYLYGSTGTKGHGNKKYTSTTHRYNKTSREINGSRRSQLWWEVHRWSFWKFYFTTHIDDFN